MVLGLCEACLEGGEDGGDGDPLHQLRDDLGLPMPWQGALGQLTNKQIDQLIGNSMQFAAISSILIYTLACTERRIPRSEGR